MLSSKSSRARRHSASTCESTIRSASSSARVQPAAAARRQGRSTGRGHGGAGGHGRRERGCPGARLLAAAAGRRGRPPERPHPLDPCRVRGHHQKLFSKVNCACSPLSVLAQGGGDGRRRCGAGGRTVCAASDVVGRVTPEVRACPISTGRRTRRVRLIRGDGRGVSD